MKKIFHILIFLFAFFIFNNYVSATNQENWQIFPNVPKEFYWICQDCFPQYQPLDNFAGQNADGVFYWNLTSDFSSGGSGFVERLEASSTFQMINTAGWHFWIMGSDIDSNNSFVYRRGEDGYYHESRYGTIISSFSAGGDNISVMKYDSFSAIASSTHIAFNPWTSSHIYAVIYTNEDLSWITDQNTFYQFLGAAPPPLNEAAADLAKQLVNSAYLVGGKGWDYNQNEFVAPGIIKTGYNFWNQAMESMDFGAGVDCSGLIMWAYNRSFDPSKSRFNNFVKAEGADEQYRYNTAPTTESELKPGDVMFFDFNDDGFIDHNVMFVGESDGFDVVSAVDRDTGIVGRFKNSLKQPGTGFVAFKKITSAFLPAVLVTAHSPIDLIVIDPDGFTITPETVIPSDLEYLREIPGVLYYSEMEKGVDGKPIDQVYSYDAKTGDYLINVLPEPNALPTDTYTLEVKTLINGEIVTTILAENVPISEIPKQPYLIKLTEAEAIPATLMKSFTAKEMKINWTADYPGKHPKDKTTFTISGSFELPDEYQKENLEKSAFLSIRINDKIVKDKVSLKELKNLWLYQEPWRKTDDSLGQGVDIKTAIINWTEEKECKLFNSECKEKHAKNWFYIRGELSLEGIDINTLPRKATVILEIPISNEKTGILAGIETIEFRKFRRTWFYNFLIKWKDWQDGWWKKWDNDETKF